MKKIVRLAGLSVMAMSLTTGVAAAQSGSIGVGDNVATGPDSYNKVEVSKKDKRKVENNNRVRVNNESYQNASSGHAHVDGNTTGGSANSGSAMNDSYSDTAAHVRNTSSSAAALASNGGSTGGTGTIGTTGPDSYNKVSISEGNYVKVQNNNDVKISNDSTQKATSGDASVSHNTTGGNATSGNASNTNETWSEVVIEN